LPLQAATVAEETQKAKSAFEALDKSGNYQAQLTMADLNNLPMGIKRTLGNVEYTVAVSGMRTGRDHAELTIYGRIKIPQDENRVLFFGASGVKFSYDGDFTGGATLLLLGDVTIPVNGNQAALILHGGFDNTTGQGIEQTCFAMDCGGFKELKIVADVVFPESLIRKVDDKGVPVTGKDAKGNPLGRVSGSFTTVASDWNDILVSLSLPRFEISGLDGFIFDIKNAVFDFSDMRNERGVKFPDGYESEYLIPGQANMWRGVYISELSVILPRQFAEQNSDRRTSFAATDMLLDNNGISGLFAGRDILSFDRGSAGGWKFSVREFSMEIRANQLVGAGFSGSIGLPVSEVSELGYTAFISPGNEYMLKVNPAKAVSFDIWAATAKIEADSYVKLTVTDGKFVPEAMLNGSLSISATSDASSSASLAKLDDIKFTGMHLQTVAPYFSVKSLGCEGGVSLKGFPLSISKLGLTTGNGEAKLGFDAKLALAGDKVPVMAQTRLEIVHSVGAGGNWKYKKLDVSQIVVDATMAEVFSLKGSLTLLNNDPTYGNGFAGAINLKVTKGIELGVDVRAIFGNKDYRYWFVDGLADFPTGIPVFPPAVQLTGFGGGAYYQMKPDGTGGSPTGSQYIPDNKYGLGLKASVLLNIGKKGLVDGEASFEIAFNKNGGVNFISFFGQAKFLGEIPGKSKNAVAEKFRGTAKKEANYTPEELEKMKQNDPNTASKNLFPSTERLGEAGLLAAMGIRYDFTNKSLHATFDLYINAVNGMLRGVGSGNKAGGAVFHVEPDKWYLHMGTPTNQMGVEFNLANLISMKTQSYFMAGHDIPGSPPPPQQVANILGVDTSKLNYMRDMNALGDGRGFAFGSSLSISTGDITFLILYANFQAGLGFDIMLKDYGNAHCEGRSGTIGIDGWYANGQAYAYLQGELGVKVNLLFIKKKIPVIKGAAATLVQAKLPNPSWFAGYLGVKLDLLGGLISGRMNMHISLGEECRIVMPASRLLEMEIIGDITPNDRMSDVDVFTSPQAAFNMNMEKTFTMDDDTGAKSYRIKLDEFSITQGGTPLTGKLTWNSTKNVVSFYPNDILPSQKELKAVVRIAFEEYKNGYWLRVKENNKELTESREITFTTGVAPDIIPMQNILYTYPVIDQKFFLTGETNEAYVQLKQGQPYLFTNEMRHEIHIVKANGETRQIPFKYNSADRRIEYSMPTIDKSSAYTFNLLSFALASETGQDTERRKTVELETEDRENNDVTVRDAQAGETIRGDAGKSLLSYGFASSAYSTFKDKVENVKKTNPYVWRYGEHEHEQNMGTDYYLQYNIAKGEPFDVAELVGTSWSGNKSLVDAYATLIDNYYQVQVKPLVYAKYPLDGMTFTHRNPAVFGVPPARALMILSAYLTQIEQGIMNDVAASVFPYRYDLQRAYHMDFLNLREQVVGRYVNSPEYSKYNYLMEASFSRIFSGEYEIELRYRFPNGKQGSAGKFTYLNAVR
jgi:hypothetical protein